MPIISKVWLLQEKFEGIPKLGDFKLIEEELPDIKDGELICEAAYLSVDPYMRNVALKPPTTMIGTQVAKVIQSKNPNYPIDSYIYGHFGWRTHTHVKDPENLNKTHTIKPYPCPDFGNLPTSLALGVCGRTGLSAYFGFLELCEPKTGEVVVVSGAAGAVGILVGQIAKIKGCHVIGIAGSDDKCKWLTEELGFDATINYKKDNIDERLRQLAPNGVDCFFDNIGGMLNYYVVNQMRNYGRISICGTISIYNNVTGEVTKVPMFTDFHRRNLRMEGFLVNRWIDGTYEKWFAGIKQMLEWVKSGQIKYKETIIDGFENMPQAFIDIFTGKHTGKPLIKV